MRPRLRRFLIGVGAACAAAAMALPPGAGAASPVTGVAGVKNLPTIDNYIVREAPAESLEMPLPELPDLKRFSLDAVMAKIDKKPAGHIRYQRLIETQELHEFTGKDGRIIEWASRQSSNPRVIVVDGGYMTPADLARALPPDHFEQTSKGVFVLRMPLIVARGATLHIDDSVREFRMSEERAAFLVNDGKLFITNTAVIGWREKENAPAKFRDGSRFRPFLLSWGGTETYIVGSKVNHLGYDASKSYGVSISQYSPGISKKMNRSHPTGWLIDSEFVDNWYAFYCYEADDIVIARNKYRDNIVYGIDPHDRSSRLIIAENEVTGTKKKHGIITSREVNDSWIFRNRVSGSGLSGIVLDRASIRNVIAENVVYGNSSDGITIYESGDNLLWGNQAVGNDRHGIRVRNSQGLKLYHNSAVSNGLSGIYGHIKDLTGTDRDMRVDPFEAKVSLVVVGGRLTNNKRGPVAIDRPLSLELYKVELLAPTSRDGLRIKGLIGELQPQVLDLLVRQQVPVVIEPAGKAKAEGT
ncbi:MAG: Carbohydrate-binding and sugar hydrolysis [Panacagrimonas sp.]|jgi:poly(beta-D-mannuronate) C5 epimerase|nr:mannuronan 5-epimerase AlgG [Panacagrimonas sp.]MCC2658190.1 Carbohydrate-binding and sugar hydrolysis [Panacagrimonas sp.]